MKRSVKGRNYPVILQWLLLCAVLFGAKPVSAQRVDTIGIYSPSMDKIVKNVVILPKGYETDKRAHYPVVYLLHGYNNRYDGWLRKTKPDLPEAATRFGMIFVCPDGQSSWYWDSPVDPKSRYETYVSKELIPHIDSAYRTVASPAGRAITGFSMGGHGALWLAFRHQNLFGACGSMSGGVDFRPFPENWKIKEQLGPYAQNRELWYEHTVMSQLYHVAPRVDRNREVASNQAQPVTYVLQPGQLAIIIDCGTDDYFYRVNEELHEQMLYYNISHDYIVRAGNHSHAYWRSAADYQLLFFRKFFDGQL